eukprot:m51a1_g1926 putative 3-hydroxyacyl-CoA dehydrogenase (169) ;mRNA; r:874718-875347
MRGQAFPDVQALKAELFHLHTLTVTAAETDEYGHMNICHYMAIYNTSLWRLSDDLGIDAEYRKTYGTFNVEHHIRYLHEVRAGDTVSVYCRAVARSASRRKMQFVLLMLNERTGVVASTLEAMLVHIDMSTRRSCPMQDAPMCALDAMVSAHSALNWPAPIAGYMDCK